MRHNTTQQNIAFLEMKQKAGQINTELALQRGYVWTSEQQQEFINSLVANYPIGTLHVVFPDVAQLEYDIIDGKQRLTTIFMFMEDKFPWKKKNAPEKFHYLFEKQNTKRLFFSELPLEIQGNIRNSDFTVVSYFDIANLQEEIQIFRNLNNGSKLSNYQKVMASNSLLRTKYSSQILKHPYLKKIFTEKALKGDKAEQYFISLLGLIFAYLNNNQVTTPIRIDDEPMFKKYPDYFLSDSNKFYSLEEINEWASQIEKIIKDIKYYLNLANEENYLIGCRNRGQLVFSLYYAYVYGLNKEQFFKLCDYLKKIKTEDMKESSSNQNSYDLRMVKSWMSHIEDKIIPQL